jgi:hypothetical protein
MPSALTWIDFDTDERNRMPQFGLRLVSLLERKREPTCTVLAPTAATSTDFSERATVE